MNVNEFLSNYCATTLLVLIKCPIRTENIKWSRLLTSHSKWRVADWKAITCRITRASWVVEVIKGEIQIESDISNR